MTSPINQPKRDQSFTISAAITDVAKSSMKAVSVVNKVMSFAMNGVLDATTIKGKQIIGIGPKADLVSTAKTGGKIILLLASIPTALCLPLIALHATHQVYVAVKDLKNTFEKDKAIKNAVSQVMVKNGSEHLGKLKNNDIIKVSKNFDAIKNSLSDEISKLSGPDKINAESKLAQLSEMVTYANDLKTDFYTDNIINRLVDCRLEIKSSGLSAEMPKMLQRPKVDASEDDKKMGLADKNGKVFENDPNVHVDKNGKYLGNLRTPERESSRNGSSIFEKFSVLLEKNGGDAKIIESKYYHQGMSSWSPASCVVKQCEFEFRDIDKETYYQGKPNTFNNSVAEGRKLPEFQNKDRLITSLLWHRALTAEVLTNMEFEGKENGKLTIYRTFDEVAFQVNGVNTKVAANDIKIKSAVIESGSLGFPVIAYGNLITKQEIPIHKITSCYFTNPYMGSSTVDVEAEFEYTSSNVKINYSGVKSDRRMSKI
ncbi:MAG: hypothetical protein H0T62_02020 [Parachlamydiaceae bacterium]|nr:hypothetical protein [Parachlamydiaceae bacterium]